MGRGPLYAGVAAGLLVVLGGVVAWGVTAKSHAGAPAVWTVLNDDPLVAFGSEDAGTVNRTLAKKALHVARGDPTFRKIVEGARITVVGTSTYGEPWSDSVTVKIKVRQQRTITADLPSIDFTGDRAVKAPEECRQPHYVVDWIRDKATGIFAVYVTADLKTKRVLEIWTRAHRHVYSRIAGRTPHAPCPQSDEG